MAHVPTEQLLLMRAYLDLRRQMQAHPERTRAELHIARARAVETQHQERMDAALSAAGLG